MSSNTAKILLAGKTGQLGGEILKNAAEFGFEVVAPEFRELDVTKYEELERAVKTVRPEILLNASAYNATTKAEEEPQSAFMLNFEVVRSMAKICRALAIKFVTYSTDYVFDGMKGAPYTETDCPNPLQVYGISKLAGEYAALNYHPEGSYVIRTCGLYGGKTGSPIKGNVVLSLLKEAKEKKMVEVASDQFGSPTYAKHLAVATSELVKAGVKPGIYHLVNEGYCSWYEFAQELFRAAGIGTEVVPVERSKNVSVMQRPAFGVLSNTRAKSLGVVLPSWQEGLLEYLDFLQL